MNPRELAEKIVTELFYWRRINGKPINDLKWVLESLISSALEEAKAEVYKEIVYKQAAIYGESIMLGKKVITNEELYKQPIDYIKEAKADQNKIDAETEGKKTGGSKNETL